MKKLEVVEIPREQFEKLIASVTRARQLALADISFAERSIKLHQNEQPLVFYYTGRKVELVKQEGELFNLETILQAFANGKED